VGRDPRVTLSGNRLDRGEHGITHDGVVRQRTPGTAPCTSYPEFAMNRPRKPAKRSLRREEPVVLGPGIPDKMVVMGLDPPAKPVVPGLSTPDPPEIGHQAGPMSEGELDHISSHMEKIYSTSRSLVNNLRYLTKHGKSPKVRQVATVCREQLAGPDGILNIYSRIFRDFAAFAAQHGSRRDSQPPREQD
jgi:hypothetical protein